MNKLLTFIVFIFTLAACREQTKTGNPNLAVKQIDTLKFKSSIPKGDSIWNDFSLKWKADSLGKNGFRLSYYSFEKSTRTWLINRRHLKGYSKERVENILGRATHLGYGREDGLLMLF